MTLIELYESQRLDGADGENSRALLEQTHWFMANADFDPMTGEALPQALSTFLARAAQTVTDARLHDRLWRITEHARPSVERLFRALNESPRREQALLPIRSVRELDANSFIKLSNRPGRNIREKLARNPYLQAVRRFQSVNLPENRLLKAFVMRLAELLTLRMDYLGEEEDDLLPKIHFWLLSDEAKAISRWDNLPPNNTLLSHRDYARVWDAWRWLQTLDDDIARDFSQLEVRAKTLRRWNEYGRMYVEGTHLFAEMPLLFDCEEDYAQFEIRPWLSQLAFKKTTETIARSFDTREIYDPVCVDLAVLRPRYATTKGTPNSLSETYLWQQWKNSAESVPIELFNSDAAYLHPDAKSIPSTDLIFSKNNSLDHLNSAARVFATRLHKVFKNDTLIWLVPDFLNDFELEIIRRNLNARFPNAEPLPRSVAAVFERIDYSIITDDGFRIVVVDTIGGRTCVTKLIAHLDPELKRRLPETNGFYWERCPELIISHKDIENPEEQESHNYDIITVDGKGHWRDRSRPETHPFIDPNTLKRDKRIGNFESHIILTESPVVGGIRLHTLQQRSGIIPLWRDHIPELSIKVMREGHYQRFYLVSRGTTVKPIRGLSVRIPVCEDFTLPAGKTFYQFPLFQGENADEVGFSARLDSPAFPLKKNTLCRLGLTFAYGTDEPYKLTFTPLDNSFPNVCANWRRTEETIITDAPAPGYPPPSSWLDLRSLPKPDSEQTSDLLEWMLSAIDRLDRDLFVRRAFGEINSYWHEDVNGNHFTFAECAEMDVPVFIHEKEFVEGLNYEDFQEGDTVSFELLEKQGGRYSGLNVAMPDYGNETQLHKLDGAATKDVVKSIRKSLYVPFIQIWRDGRSITDTNCPKEFADAVKDRIAYLTGLVSLSDIPQAIVKEIQFLLACLHKDTTDACVQWLTEQVEDNKIRDPRAVGFSLGDLSDGWQEYIFSRLVSNPNASTISVFAYAIWREQCFVETFVISELQATLNALSLRLANVRPLTGKEEGKGNKWIARDWVRAVAEPLELLLGLLRTRTSSDPDIKMLLQPHQKITKELAERVEKVTEIVEQSHVDLYSRVQLNIHKPNDERTPDLLYALRLYLTGDDGANAIHITSVSDNDNE